MGGHAKRSKRSLECLSLCYCVSQHMLSRCARNKWAQQLRLMALKLYALLQQATAAKASVLRCAPLS
jgi:hypothetical protein